MIDQDSSRSIDKRLNERDQEFTKEIRGLQEAKRLEAAARGRKRKNQLSFSLVQKNEGIR